MQFNIIGWGVNVLPNEKVLNAKKAVVANLAEELKAACIGVVVSYKGITVESDTKLRKELREAGVKYTVVKNTMLNRAAEIAGIKIPQDVLEGSTAIAMCKDDYIAPAKILCNFANNNEFYKIKSGFIDGKVVTSKEINEISKLPSREILIAKALGGIQAPLTGFASVLNGTVRSLAIVLNAIAEKKSA